MLDKYQKNTIIPLLENAGLIDKELKFGCIIESYGAFLRIGRGPYKQTKYQETLNGIKGLRLINAGCHTFVLGEDNFEVIGQYNLQQIHTLLMKKGYTVRVEHDGFSVFKDNGELIDRFKTMKEPMERDEDINKRLANLF